MPFVCSLPTLRRTILSGLLLLFISGFFVPSAQAADKLTIYSGRSERLIKPVLDEAFRTAGVNCECIGGLGGGHEGPGDETGGEEQKET